jgi:hypothetical protein
MVRPVRPILFAASLCGCGGSPATSTGDASTVASTTSLSAASTGSTSTTSSTSSPTTTDPTTTDPTTTATTSAATTSDPGTSTSGTTTPEPGTTADSTTGAPCEGLECQVDPCGGDPDKTVLRGTVVAPEGTLPLYNVSVYVPNAPLAPLPEGVQCDTCAGLDGDPIVAALTDTQGEFVLAGVPAGAEIPLVVTVGKWRRESVVKVAACADNLAPASATRLPRNKSEGHIPRIALTTGGADPLECLLRKLGIDDAEFTAPSGDGRVNLYVAAGGGDRFVPGLNGGALFPTAPVLWGSLVNLMKYDMVLMACEGNQNADQKTQTARDNLVKYAGVGGRLFFTHWHNVWIEKGPAPWPTVAQFNFQPDLPNPSTGTIDTGFPKGLALAEWMVAVGGSQVLGEVAIKEGQHTIDAVDPGKATRWIYTKAPLPASVQHLSFNAPVDVPADKQCGRVVDSDIHVSSGDLPGTPFPAGCSTEGLTPQEKVLAFMFFELSACLIPDDQDPVPG